MRAVLGIDGGGTKTRCLVADEDGRVLGEGLAGPSNYQVVGQATAVANILTAAEAALAVAGLSLHRVASVCAGLAGVGRPEDQVVMQDALAFLRPARLQVVPDARVALAGALAGQPGAVVISGTGSIAYGLDADGRTVRAGGWGWILGDEGSGFDIGRRAVMAALAAQDGTGPATSLTERICAEWHLERLDQLVRKVYADPVQAKADMAALVPHVLAAEAEGDAVAQGILRDAGRCLAALALAVLRRLSLPEGAPALVAVTGGVLTGARTVRLAMEEAVGTAGHVIDCLESPAEGAVRMARQGL